MRNLSLLLTTLAALGSARAFETPNEPLTGLRFQKDSTGASKAAGLAWHVCLEKEGCRLTKPLLVCSGRHSNLAYDRSNAWAVPAALGGFADFGLIRTRSGKATLQGVQSQWTSAIVTLGLAESGLTGDRSEELRITVSRLSPAVLVETQASAVELFAGAAPQFFAFGEKAISADGLSDADLSAGWLLCWFGDQSPFRAPGMEPNWHQGKTSEVKWDFPVLVVFSESVRKIESGRIGGLIFQFSGPGAIAVTPLFGEVPLAASKGGKPPTAFLRQFLAADVPATDQWKPSLPERVLQRCRFWAERLSAFPTSVAERSVYDSDKDMLSVTSSFTFRPVRKGNRRFAPISPAVALAWHGQKTATFPEKLTDPAYVSPYGPYLGIDGVDSYTWTTRGLGRYVTERRGFGSREKVPRELQECLDAETDKVLEAGIMAPWFPVVNACGQRGYHKDPQRLAFANPGENLYFITQLTEAVDDARRGRLKGLLIDWEKAYPCLKTVHMPVAEGARRERYYLHMEDLRRFPDPLRNFHLSHKLIPAENLYYAACYRETVGEKPNGNPTNILAPYLSRIDWASSGSVRWDTVTYEGKHGWGTTYRDKEYGWSGVADANRMFAALVGYLRLAQATGDDREIQRGWYFLAKAATARLAMEKFKGFLYEKRLLSPPADEKVLRYQYPWQLNLGEGIHTFRRRGAADDPCVPVIWDEFGVTLAETETHFWWLTRLVPYLGMVPELGRFLHDHAAPEVSTYCAKIAESTPEWYTAMAQCNWAGEQACMYPVDSYQIFLARAWIMEQEPVTLQQYADLPWLARGDWYYLHKLSETAKTYRSTTWERHSK